MGALKTHRLLPLCLSALFQAPAVFAQSPADAALHQFATCAGRLSAEMEHLWSFDGAAADRVAGQRAALLALVDAVMPRGAERQAMAWRIEAKVAQAALLSQAAYAANPVAGRRAQVLLAECTALIGQS